MWHPRCTCNISLLWPTFRPQSIYFHATVNVMSLFCQGCEYVAHDSITALMGKRGCRFVDSAVIGPLFGFFPHSAPSTHLDTTSQAGPYLDVWRRRASTVIRGLVVCAPLRALDLSLLTSLHFRGSSSQDNHLMGLSICDSHASSFFVTDAEPEHVPAVAMNVSFDFFLMHCTALAGVREFGSILIGKPFHHPALLSASA